MGIFNFGCGQGIHKFKARYDAFIPQGLSLQNVSNLAQVEAAKNKIYIYDICLKCGLIISNKDGNGR